MQHNNQLIDQLNGMADAFQKLKDRLTASEKSALDTEWTNNKAAVKARIDQAFKETLLEEDLYSAEVAWLLQDKTTAYAWMDSAIDFVLGQLKTKTQELATTRGQPDHGLGPAPARAQWTVAKAGSVVVEVVTIVALVLVCVKVWLLFTILLIFAEELVKETVRKIKQCRRNVNPT